MMVQQASPSTVGLISQEAIAHLLTTEQTKDELPFTPSNLRKYRLPPQDLEHYPMPMIHPVTGKSISSYKRLMNILRLRTHG
jgi:hypothetical protein